MEDSEAETVLLALGGVLEWQYREIEDVERWFCYYRLAKWGHYLFMLDKSRDEGQWQQDENGTLLPWYLSGNNTEGERAGPRPSWSFPCRTATDGKALCEYFAQTGDPSEVERLDGLWYSLYWFSDERGNQGTQYVHHRGNLQDKECYRIPRKRRWFSRFFTAEYRFIRTCLKAGDPPTSVSPHRYKIEAQAQAACERHHTTGKWE